MTFARGAPLFLIRQQNANGAHFSAPPGLPLPKSYARSSRRPAFAFRPTFIYISRNFHSITMIRRRAISRAGFSPSRPLILSPHDASVITADPSCHHTTRYAVSHIATYLTRSHLHFHYYASFRKAPHGRRHVPATPRGAQTLRHDAISARGISAITTPRASNVPHSRNKLAACAPIRLRAASGVVNRSA